MNISACFHFRALVCAAVHFAFCAILGVTVLGLVVADVMTTSSELPPPWWITGAHWVLMVLSAPMAAFFSLLDDVRLSHPVSLLLALVWSTLLGYAISFGWQVVKKRMFRQAMRNA